jgi:alginate O-acetyltransferase complex protein AlgI
VLFNTLTFGAFFAGVFALWTLLEGKGRARFGLLIGSSLAFYSAWDARYLLLLGGVAGWNWAIALGLAATERPGVRRLYLALATVGNLGVLGFWKYADFALDTLRPLADALHLRWPGALELVLPVGISFFTFQGLGYVVDVYRREREPVRPFSHLFLALAFFPHLVSGPIVRPHELIPQLLAPRPLDNERFGRSLFQFLRGLVKKAGADYLAMTLVDRVFDLPSHYSTLEVLAAIYGYSLQIYGDFSGYTDMAIGVAGMLGIDLPQNFDHPYASSSLREFWRRWHITLSSWLRDYLYIGLGGGRGGYWLTLRNLLLTMMLGGLWHGASWTFVIWGTLHGLMLVAGRLWETYGPRPAPGGETWRRALGVLLTFHGVALAWVFFRAETLAGALDLLARLWLGWGGGYANIPLPFVAVLALGFLTHLMPRQVRALGERWVVASPALVQAALAVACLYLARSLAGASTQPFIYFQF